jgi:hypothetical protein
MNFRPREILCEAPAHGGSIHCLLADSRAGDFRELPLGEGYGWRQIAMAHAKLATVCAFVLALLRLTWSRRKAKRSTRPGWFDERGIIAHAFDERGDQPTSTKKIRWYLCWYKYF